MPSWLNLLGMSGNAQQLTLSLSKGSGVNSSNHEGPGTDGMCQPENTLITETP